ncbi:MAG: AbrB family transcriptional regulator [Pararhizobium sp.]
MTKPSRPVANGPLERWPKAAQWTALVVLSAVLAALLEIAGIPAGFLLGPMLVGIAGGTNGSRIKVAPLPYMIGQALVGCLIASSITPSIILTFAREWPLFLGVVLAVIAASSTLGWLLSRWHVLPGTTAVWGSSPGGATAMMLMAEAFGADARLVAFMQYARVVMVALAASIIARLWVDTSGTNGSGFTFFESVPLSPLVQTLLLAGIGAWLGRLSRIPAGSMLVPLVVGAVLHALGLIDIVLPNWLLAPSYALIGWRIGLSFNRTILLHASRAMPRIIGSILILLAFCGCLAFMLNRLLGIDPLTAYLATSPGGMDSVAIIAASSNVDLPFVMTLQAVRFVLVLLIGPTLARFAARHGASAQSEAAR